MKLLSFHTPERLHIGLFHKGRVLDLNRLMEREHKLFPHHLEELIREREVFEPLARAADTAFKQGDYAEYTLPFASLVLAPPIQHPASCRDGYAFRQHVAAARLNRGVPMIAEFDQYPVFYFTNHNSIIGPGPVPCMADHLLQLDFELEVAVVLGRKGRNVEAKHAEDYIFGYTILNDFSARTLQMEEMLLSLGPAKGKDFANAIGPLLVTPDELQDVLVPGPKRHVGNNHGLQMLARVNGKEVSRGNLGDMDWTFAEIIERCAYGVDIFPTDLIGSGTVGTGCLLELNGTGKRLDANYTPQWLQVGDVVELEVERLGVLQNTVVLEGDASILAKKHAIRPTP